MSGRRDRGRAGPPRWGITVRGIRAEVDVGLLLLALLTAQSVQDYWPDGGPGFAAVFVATLTASVLHETGHLVFLRVTGTPVSKVVFGALSRVEAAPSPTPGHLIGRAAAGPAINLLIASLAGVALVFAPVAREVALALIIAHAVAFLNLLPIYPLDGGQVVEGIVWAGGCSRSDAAKRARRSNPWVIGALGAAIAAILLSAGAEKKYMAAAGALTVVLVAVTARLARQPGR